MLLGVDVGTGGTRAVLIDRAGRVLASFASEHAPVRSEHIGWAEQEPEDWWRTVSPWLGRLVKLVKAGIPIAAAVGAVVDEAATLQRDVDIQLLESILATLAEPSALTQRSTNTTTSSNRPAPPAIPPCGSG